MIFSLPLALALFVAVPQQPSPHALLLDDFSTVRGWKSIVSDGAVLTIERHEGRSGGCMGMAFDLSGGAGYVIAEKEFPLELPDDYEFTFDLRGDTPVNNFEFKIIDEHDNVHWIKKLNVEYPAAWTRQRIKKRHLSFAWGPAPGKPLQRVRALQFVVSAGSGGRGTVWIDNFRFQPRATGDTAGVVPVVVRGGGRMDPRGTVLTSWSSTSPGDSLVLDFGQLKELGGVVIDWDSTAFARSYDVGLSDDGVDWVSAYTVRSGKPARAYLPFGEAEGRFLKLRVLDSGGSRGVMLHRMEFMDPSFSSSANALYRIVAGESAPGRFPKAFLDQQSYWTLTGVNGDFHEALINEQGQIETGSRKFSLEPFLYVDGKLVTWNNVSTQPSLRRGYLPIPGVTWTHADGWVLSVELTAAGHPGNAVFGIRYGLTCGTAPMRGKLFIALRPFQVNPPWQFLNTQGGTARVDSIVYRDGVAVADGITVIPLTPPSSFGASEFDQGDITDHLARGTVPPSHRILDHAGHASGAFAYDVALTPGQTMEVTFAIPYQKETPSRRPEYNGLVQSSVDAWERTLRTVEFSFPPSALAVERTIRSTLAYILINRDGPGFQPGSRSYERSWIRDGSLTAAALLRLGHRDEVREFIDWYARGQFPNGKIPCVIDARGPDPVPEHDSHGQFIYAIHQYFLFSKDTVWLRGKLEAVTRTIRYIQQLRATRKTERYRTGTPEERACYGLVPESISHEGYSDMPRHSYWDDFFILRGLKDAAEIAEVLGEEELNREFSEERDDFRKDLYASMRLAIRTKGIDHIPGCVELGDFDPTSTTVGLMPGGELGMIPEPELHNTFEKYYTFFKNRRATADHVNYTPYELRVVGSFILLGQKKRAEEVLQFMMQDRRPPAWNHWAEVVWRDTSAPRFIGDMPHTWVGSDFIRSVLTMFVYERERDTAHVLCAGIPDAWIADPAGIAIEGLATYHGSISFSIKKTGQKLVVALSGSFDAGRHALVLATPLSGRVRTVRINGTQMAVPASGELPVQALPATVEYTY